jgi:hypothetical protein
MLFFATSCPCLPRSGFGSAFYLVRWVRERFRISHILKCYKKNNITNEQFRELKIYAVDVWNEQIFEKIQFAWIYSTELSEFVTCFPAPDGGILGLIGSRISTLTTDFFGQAWCRNYASLIPIGPLLLCLVSDWFRPTSCLAAVESSPAAARTGPSRSGIWTTSTTHTISGYQETSVYLSHYFNWFICSLYSHGQYGALNLFSLNILKLEIFLYIFGVCWPLLWLCRPFCTFERCLDSNQESCCIKQARYQLIHPSL